MQMEAVECGAASLAMILAYYGKWIPLEQVRAECGVSRDGASMSNIVKAAKYYGLEAKGKAIAVSGLRDFKQLPCIIYWNFKHFVVLDGFRGNYAILNDPAKGTVKVPMEIFEESYTGMMIALSPGENFEKGGSKPKPFSFIKKRMKGMYGAIFLIMLLVAVASVARILYTSVGRGFTDYVLTGDDPGWLTGFAIVMLITAFVVSVMSILSALQLKRLEGRTAVVSSSRFMQHLLRLPVDFYSQRSVGDIQIRQRENETIMFTLMSLLAPSLINIVMLVLYATVMFSYSPLLTCVGVGMIIDGSFTSGSLLAFTGFLGMFTNPANQLILLGQTIQQMEVQMDRVEDVMKYPADVPEDTITTETELSSLRKLSGQVELKNITFGYSPLKDPLIKDFNLMFTPGKWVALVGTSGSGKSTVAKLVSGLYQPWEGEITFDGVPLSKVPREQLKSSMAVVDQDIVTFDDSISDNVRLWDHSIEEFEIILACRDANIHDDITLRPEGYFGRVLPRGSNFSGGQLQRLEIARVLAMDPTILVLDEATSALDNITQKVVAESLAQLKCTRIVVAHRLSTVKNCDRIMVVDKGTIAEEGTYEELIEKNDLFAELVRRQRLDE